MKWPNINLTNRDRRSSLDGEESLSNYSASGREGSFRKLNGNNNNEFFHNNNNNNNCDDKDSSTAAGGGGADSDSVDNNYEDAPNMNETRIFNRNRNIYANRLVRHYSIQLRHWFALYRRPANQKVAKRIITLKKDIS